MVEYGSTPYMMFMLGEYVAIVLMCALTTILFMGGWLPPIDVAPLNWIPGAVWFVLKTCLVFFMFAMVKAFVPRYRYDQLMRLGWKVFLPISIVMIFVVALVLQLTGWGWHGGVLKEKRHMRAIQFLNSLLLREFVSTFFLAMRYFFKPKPTINYPFEKGYVSHVFAVNMRCVAIQMGKSAASPANCVRRSVRRKRSPLKLAHARMMAHAARCVTILTW